MALNTHKLPSDGAGQSNHSVYESSKMSIVPDLNFHHKKRKSSFPDSTSLCNIPARSSDCKYPVQNEPVVYTKPKVDEKKQVENKENVQPKGNEIPAPTALRPQQEQPRVLARTSLPSHSSAEAARAALGPRRFTVSSYFTKASVSRPGLNTPLSTSAFVSQMPPLSLKRNNMEWVYPAKDYMPKEHKVKILIWSDLTLNHLEQLNECKNADCVKNKLAEIFWLQNFDISLKSGIIIDLYYYTLQFSRKQEFTPEKTSTVFSIVKKIFEVCTETSFGNLDHTFKFFKELLIAHSVQRPPFSIELFTTCDVRKISDYVVNTFFRHFKMYKYAFTPLVRLNVDIRYSPEAAMPSESKHSPGLNEIREEDTPVEVSVTSLENSKDRENEKEGENARIRDAAVGELQILVKRTLLEETKKIEGSLQERVLLVTKALNAKIDEVLGEVKVDKKK